MPELLRDAPPFATLTSPAFDAIAAEARATMNARQPGLDARWRMGTWQSWGFLQAEGVLHFADPDGSGLKAPGQLLGSYDAETGTWEWAWNNPTVVNPAIVADARAVRAYGEAHELAPLTTGVVKASVPEAVGMVAVAVTVSGAEGAYWGIVGGRYMFVIGFSDVTVVLPTATSATEPTAPPARQRPREVGDAFADLPALLRWSLQVGRYVSEPLALMRSVPTPTTNTLATLGPEDEQRLPAALREYMADAERGLANLGFGPPVRAANLAAADIRSCVTFLEHPADGSLGFIAVWAGEHVGLAASATFRTDFADGAQLLTSNFQALLRTPSRPNVLGARFPDVHDAAELYDIHRFRVAERRRTVDTVPLTRGADVLAFEAREAQEVYDFWVKKGYYRRVDGDAIQFTRRGAALAAWRGLFPWRHVTKWRNGRDAARVMRRYRCGRRP
jgi:hypothetical protein